MTNTSHAFSLFSLCLGLAGCALRPTEEARQVEGSQRIHALYDLIPPPSAPSASADVTSADKPHLCWILQVAVEGSGIRVEFEPMGLARTGKSFRAEIGQILTPSDLGLVGCSVRAERLGGRIGVTVEAHSEVDHRAEWIEADRFQRP